VVAARIRILSQYRGPLELSPELAESVEVVSVPPEQASSPELTGQILLAVFGNDAVYELAERGVEWVHYIGTGLDRIDVARLARGRVLTNSRGAATIPISEWVLAVLLEYEKQLDSVFLHEPPTSWPLRKALGTLHGRTIALFGFGSIGVGVATRALAFGAKIRALRNSRRPSPLPGIELVDSFAELVRDADHLVLSAPLTDATRHVLDTKAFGLLKPGVHIVNIARGGLIDQDALRIALDGGIVARASLDAVTPEPPPDDHWLYTHPKVRLSPHISWSWPGAVLSVQQIFADNLRRYLAGEPLENVIDPALGY
jgi:phosphoglycerate dehydrogenase-like enzyme